MRGSKVLQQALKRIPHYRSGKGGEALAEIDVVISSSVADMDQWLEDNVLGAHSPPSSRIGGKIVLGFDIEWRPNRNKGKNNKAALVQLATTNSVLLYQFGNFTSIPISLCNVIKSDSVLKTGVGVLEDLKKLEIDYGILIDNSAYHDIGMAARQFDVFGNDIMNDDEGDEGTTLDETKEVEEDKLSNKKYGLGSLVEEFFGMNVSKPRKIQMSNWENSTLTDDQIMYASYDALMSIDCYKHLYDQGAFEENRKEAMLKNAVASLAIGDRIEVSCRNTMRILYLCMMESSEYLDRTGEYVRKGNENYLQHLLNSELDSDLIDSSLPLLSWNKVAQNMLARLGSTASYHYRSNRDKNASQLIEVDVVVMDRVLGTGAGESKKSAIAQVCRTVALDLLSLQQRMLPAEWITFHAGKQSHLPVVYNAYFLSKPRI